MSQIRIALREMLAAARAEPGRPVRRALVLGLVVELTQKKNGDVQLTIARNMRQPSDAECRAILAQFPEAVPEQHVIGPYNYYRDGTTFKTVYRWPRPVAVEG